MFRANATCPVDVETRAWIDGRFTWLIGQFGRERPQSTVILPTADFFPDKFDGRYETVRLLFDRVCGYMGVDPNSVEISEYEDRVPVQEGNLVPGTAGLYEENGGNFRIWLNVSNFDDPLALVATMTHELGHVLLLGQGRISPEEPDHEPLTDLLAVYLGLGVIQANAVIREATNRMGAYSNWQMSRQGYLSMQAFGYALAVFAKYRDEKKPKWARHLRADVRLAFDQACRFLAEDDLSAALPDHAYFVAPIEIRSTHRVASAELHSEVDANVCSYCNANIDPSAEDGVCPVCSGSVEANCVELEEAYAKREAGARWVGRLLVVPFLIAILLVIFFIINNR